MKGAQIVGQVTARKDGVAKVTGQLPYASDINIPGMMYGVVLRSPYAHAEIVSIDTSEAEAMGAVCLTYEDINPILYNERSVSVPDATFRDRTVLPKKARHFGEPIAAVAAETEEEAYKAMKALKVEYKVLPAVFTAEEAMKPGAPQLYDKVYLGDKEVKIENNVAVIRNIEEGDVEEGFRQADLIVEETYKTQRTYHSQLETKGAVCKPEPDGGITIWATAQSIHANRQLIAQIYNIPLSKVNVKRTAIGGGFGGSIQVNTVTPICAGLALKARRPVKLISAREEDFYSHAKYPNIFHVKLGVTKDGIITAAHVKALVEIGAHHIQALAYLGCVSGWFASLYKYQSNIKFEGKAVYTNKVPACALQGYGNPDVNFAIESTIDIIAEKLNMDPIELRLKNYRGTGDEFWGQGPTIRSIIKSCGVEESLVKGRELFNWKERTKPSEKTGHIRRGIGVARGFHTSGTGGPKEGEVIDYSSDYIKINEDGSVDVVCPVVDHGGGTWDAITKIVADVLQVPLDMVEISPSDTRTTGYDVCTHATRGVFCGGGAAYFVAHKVKERLLEFAARIMLENPIDLDVMRDDELGQGVVYVKNFPEKRITIGKVAKTAQINSWGTIAYADSYRQKNCPPCFVAHFVEVEVNTKTGEISFPKVLIYGDCGTPVNPDLVEGQLIGAFNRGMGFAIYEDTLYEENEIGNLKCHGYMVDYKTPTSYEMPLAENIIVRLADTYEPTGPFGAKGMGEAAFSSVAAAISNAIYNAIGIRFTELPLTPEKVLKAIKEKGI
ncbi:MAG TPA: xanthine dehydrogenase family protein molybdopterin-binding subunit [Clostridia bacterium]|nr:xanthine dehydrogenase family protein molybdopterin-binding subunit [Clostridia bacterium]